MHPGANRKKETINHQLYPPPPKRWVKAAIKKYDTCQLSKNINIKFGYITEKETETEPREKLCIDLIGPYTIQRKGKHKLYITLQAVTIIDPTMVWFKK